MFKFFKSLFSRPKRVQYRQAAKDDTTRFPGHSNPPEPPAHTRKAYPYQTYPVYNSKGQLIEYRTL